MPRDDERQQTGREAVQAFRLVAAALESPIPKLLADLAAPEEGLHDLERKPPLVYFSYLDALPKDIAYDRDEPVHPPAEATRAQDRFTEHEATRFDAGWGGAKDLSHAAVSEARPPIFSFRRSGATGTSAGRGDRDAREGSMDRDAVRGYVHVSGTAPEDSTQEGPVNSAYAAPSTPEYPEMTHDYVNGNVAGGALQAADPMSLLDGLAEDALGAVKSQARGIPVHPANTPTQTIRSREPDRESHGGETDAPVYPPAEHSLVPEDWDAEGLLSSEDRDGRWGEGPVAATDPRKTESGKGGVTALIDSLVEDLFSSPIRTPEAPLGPDVYAPEVVDRPGEPVALDRSIFAALYGAFDESADGLPLGAETLGTDKGALERVPKQYVDPEAFAALVNDVLVRQARRHGVDLS